jgi:hypothetical protein
LNIADWKFLNLRQRQTCDFYQKKFFFIIYQWNIYNNEFLFLIYGLVYFFAPLGAIHQKTLITVGFSP